MRLLVYAVAALAPRVAVSCKHCTRARRRRRRRRRLTIVASRAGEGGKNLYRGDVCTGWDYRKGSRWNDYWWHDDWDDDWLWNDNNGHGHGRTVQGCVEINR